MDKQIKWDMPGYNNYHITLNPFRIISQKYHQERELKFTYINNAHPRVKLFDGSGSSRQLSIVHLAALAFWGQSPRGFIAIFVGNSYDNIMPENVWWMPEHEVKRFRRSHTTEKQRFEIERLYFEVGLTQTQIAERYGISQTSVYRLINYRPKFMNQS